MNYDFDTAKKVSEGYFDRWNRHQDLTNDELDEFVSSQSERIGHLESDCRELTLELQEMRNELLLLRDREKGYKKRIRSLRKHLLGVSDET